MIVPALHSLLDLARSEFSAPRGNHNALFLMISLLNEITTDQSAPPTDEDTRLIVEAFRRRLDSWVEVRETPRRLEGPS